MMDSEPSSRPAEQPEGSANPADDLGTDWAIQRQEMVEKQIRGRGIRDPRVLAAMLAVPRHAFIPSQFLGQAYLDQPLAIGEGQTISQPFMVGSMTEALELSPEDRVLEVGTGSGYQTAVLSLLTRAVYTIESRRELGEAARERLARLGYDNVRERIGDGTLGWPEEAPFDGIVVTAAAPLIPPPLVAQLADGGRLVLPVGSADTQELLRIRRRGADLFTESFYHCRFVPLVGRHGWSDNDPDIG
jgi:protein-L-isoaspartate(D-aspartate) O-methyltransferase